MGFFAFRIVFSSFWGEFGVALVDRVLNWNRWD